MNNLNREENIWLEAFYKCYGNREIEIKEALVYADTILKCFQDRFPINPIVKLRYDHNGFNEDLRSFYDANSTQNSKFSDDDFTFGHTFKAGYFAALKRLGVET